MSKYLKLFNTTAEYNAYTADTENFILPNVSCTMDDLTKVYYNPWVETRVVAKFNVTDTSSPTKIAYGTSNLAAIEIDGVKQGSVTTSYTFDTVGEHTVKYTLTDPTSIDFGSFGNCSSLTSINIPSGVTSIGSYAFSGCTSLTSIDIPDSVTSIGGTAFAYCSGLTSVTIPDGVTSIGNTTFFYCSSLTSIDIPDSVTSIGQSVFEACSSLTSIEITSGVTSIGRNAFSGCRSLTSITINAPTPPTLGSDVFINTNNCPIYVPSENVETYKSASGWSGYASRIQEIP